MKYSYEFKKSFWVLFTLVLILAGLVALFNALKLFGVFYSGNRFSEILSLFAALVVALFLSLAAFGTGYQIDDKFLKIKIAFITVYKIMHNEITNIREYKKENKLILGYISRKDRMPHALNVGIGKQYFDNLADELRRKNPEILYDINND